MKDMTGVKFGRWTVIKRYGSDKNGHPLWVCRCECGTEKPVDIDSLRRGHSVSCGCFAREQISARSRKHGMAWNGEKADRLYRIWTTMKRRCYSQKHIRYPRYGGRGIQVCPEWMEFLPFMDWALSHGYREDLTIDRIDNDGNYCPENCRWITNAEQQKNKSNSRRLAEQMKNEPSK